MATSYKDRATFVFKGTVRRARAATMKQIKDKRRTVVVRVDEIVRCPSVLVDYAGQDITLALAKGERVKKDQQCLFYTGGMVFGESLAVQSYGHEAVRATRMAMAARGAPDPVLAARRHEVHRRATDANVVVTGRVVAVGEAETAPPPQLRATRAVARPTPAQAERISEHAPLWSEAVVEVGKVHKGAGRKKHVVVRFPASTDAHWHRAPKFQVGHEGVFMLNEDASDVPRMAATTRALSPRGAYSCLHEAGFQPAHRQAEVSTAIEAAESKDS